MSSFTRHPDKVDSNRPITDSNKYISFLYLTEENLKEKATSVNAWSI